MRCLRWLWKRRFWLMAGGVVLFFLYGWFTMPVQKPKPPKPSKPIEVKLQPADDPQGLKPLEQPSDDDGEPFTPPPPKKR